MSRYILLIASIVLFATTGMFAQSGSGGSLSNADFWVDHWSRPPVIIFGPQEEDFYKNVQAIHFPWNDHDEPSNPSDLESNVRWLRIIPTSTSTSTDTLLLGAMTYSTISCSRKNVQTGSNKL